MNRPGLLLLSALSLLALVTVSHAETIRGALVLKKGEDQPVAASYYRARWTRISFNRVEYDTDGFFNAADNTFKIPAGISFARIQCQLVFSHNPVGYRQAAIAKNGLLFPGFAAANVRAIGGTTTDINISTPILPVKQGDIFHCGAWQMQDETEPSLDVHGTESNSGVWFAIQAW